MWNGIAENGNKNTQGDRGETCGDYNDYFHYYTSFILQEREEWWGGEGMERDGEQRVWSRCWCIQCEDHKHSGGWFGGRESFNWGNDDVGLKPDTISYNYLMTCYCKNELMDEAQIVYDDLEKNGCNPNAATFRILIFYLCKKERYKTGYKVFKT